MLTLSVFQLINVMQEIAFLDWPDLEEPSAIIRPGMPVQGWDLRVCIWFLFHIWLAHIWRKFWLLCFILCLSLLRNWSEKAGTRRWYFEGTNSNRASLVAQTVKNLPAIQKTWIQSLCWEDPLEEGMATHSSILAWRIPWTEEPGGLQTMGSQESQTWLILSLSLCL